MKEFLISFGFALKGIANAFGKERNLKVQLGIGLLTIGAGFYFAITALEWVAIAIMIALVLSLEMMNTAIENLVNLVTLERNPLAGKIKDIAAGAVLVASVIAVVVGILIFKKYIIAA